MVFVVLTMFYNLLLIFPALWSLCLLVQCCWIQVWFYASITIEFNLVTISSFMFLFHCDIILTFVLSFPEGDHYSKLLLGQLSFIPMTSLTYWWIRSVVLCFYSCGNCWRFLFSGNIILTFIRWWSLLHSASRKTGTLCIFILYFCFIIS